MYLFISDEFTPFAFSCGYNGPMRDIASIRLLWSAVIHNIMLHMGGVVDLAILTADRDGTLNIIVDRDR